MLDIMIAILESSKVPIKKTHILFQVRINSTQLKRYINFLLAAGMLESTGSSEQTLSITEKGLYVQEIFKSKNNAINSIRIVAQAD